MLMYEIVLLLIGTSLFLLGLSVGGVIEYRRMSNKAARREEVYLYNLAQTAKMIHRIENKIATGAKKSDDRWNITKEIHHAVVDTKNTQRVKLQEHTPPLPWQFSNDPDVTDPGYDI